jgi:peptidyl-tRNA hydrolase
MGMIFGNSWEEEDEWHVDSERPADPYVMYLVVKTSLKMNVGKTAAQCGHAVQMLMCWIHVLRAVNNAHNRIKADVEEQDAMLEEAKHWLEDDFPSYAKIVLAASDEEFETVKQTIAPLRRFLVTDRGFTSVAAGTETVLGLWPCKKSLAPQIVKSLKLLR